MNADLVRLSKRISRALRHAPESAGLRLDRHGWVPVDELVAALGITRDQLDAVVAGNDKQRFAIERDPGGREVIRASQGHSVRVPIDLGLPAVVPPDRLFHGTQEANLPAIRREGLRPGRRHHVHLSADEATARVVGRRRAGTVVVLRVRAGAMATAGYEFYRSANGVWLTARVPPEFLAPG